MISKIDQLIEQGQGQKFENNCHTQSHGTYGRTSVEFLAWTASSEHYILNNFGEASPFYKLFLTYDPSRIDGYLQNGFDSQRNIVLGALKACKDTPPKAQNGRFVKEAGKNQIIALIGNIYFWSAILIIGSSSFTLGITIGNSRFDNEKNVMYQENITLKKEANLLRNQIKSISIKIKKSQ